MATFFEQQAIAKKKTGRLVFLFGFAVVLLIFFAYLLLMSAIVLSEVDDPSEVRLEMFFEPYLFFGLTAGISLMIIIVSLVKIKSLKGGGKVIAESLGGRLIDASDYDPQYSEVLNIVEEMAIASGTPVPSVYVLENEQGINAFAAGYHPGDAVIGVTKGAIEKFNRDEMQAVIAHEFSHILNGDMGLNIKLIGYLAGIFSLAIVGRMLLYSMSGRNRSRSGNNKGAGAILLIGLGFLILGYIGVLIGRIIKAAVSRQREYLADASSVQFTRNPAGIYSALAKIGGHDAGSRLKSEKAEEASHMFFANGIRNFFGRVFATHPGIEERLKAVEANAPKGMMLNMIEEAEKTEQLKKKAAEEEAQREAERAAKGESEIDPERMFRRTVMGGAMAQGAGAEGQAAAGAVIAGGMMTGGSEEGDVMTGAMIGGAAASARERSDADGEGTVMSSVGGLDDSHIAYARKIIQEIPDDIKDAAHESFGARAVIYCLLLDRKDQEVRKKQVSVLKSNADPDVFELSRKLARSVAALPVRCRIPLVDMTVPALLELSQNQYQVFKGNVMALIEADDMLDVGEWILLRVLMHHMAEHFEGKTPPAEKKKLNQSEARDAAVTVLSVIAGFTDDQSDIENAFEKGAKVAGLASASIQKGAGVQQLNAALDVLEGLKPMEKEKFMKGLGEVIASDGIINETEAELFRAIGDSLNIPIPPVIPGQKLQ